MTLSGLKSDLAALRFLVLQPPRQPRLHFAVPELRVLGVEHPVVLVGEDDELALDALALQRRPVFERVVDRHAEIVFADRDQRRRLELRREADRILLAPDRALFPDRPAVADFAAVDRVRGAPLRFEIDQAGMADEAAVTR